MRSTLGSVLTSLAAIGLGILVLAHTMLTFPATTAHIANNSSAVVTSAIVVFAVGIVGLVYIGIVDWLCAKWEFASVIFACVSAWFIAYVLLMALTAPIAELRPIVFVWVILVFCTEHK